MFHLFFFFFGWQVHSGHSTHYDLPGLNDERDRHRFFFASYNAPLQDTNLTPPKKEEEQVRLLLLHHHDFATRCVVLLNFFFLLLLPLDKRRRKFSHIFLFPGSFNNNHGYVCTRLCERVAVVKKNMAGVSTQRERRRETARWNIIVFFSSITKPRWWDKSLQPQYDDDASLPTLKCIARF